MMIEAKNERCGVGRMVLFIALLSVGLQWAIPKEITINIKLEDSSYVTHRIIK